MRRGKWNIPTVDYNNQSLRERQIIHEIFLTILELCWKKKEERKKERDGGGKERKRKKRAHRTELSEFRRFPEAQLVSRRVFRTSVSVGVALLVWQRRSILGRDAIARCQLKRHVFSLHVVPLVVKFPRDRDASLLSRAVKPSESL